MHLGNTSTGGQKPRKAFEVSKAYYSKKIDFGESSVGDGKVYRRRGIDKKNWFWITVKLLVLGFILFVMIMLFTQGLIWR